MLLSAYNQNGKFQQRKVQYKPWNPSDVAEICEDSSALSPFWVAKLDICFSIIGYNLWSRSAAPPWLTVKFQSNYVTKINIHTTHIHRYKHAHTNICHLPKRVASIDQFISSPLKSTLLTLPEYYPLLKQWLGLVLHTSAQNNIGSLKKF